MSSAQSDVYSFSFFLSASKALRRQEFAAEIPGVFDEAGKGFGGLGSRFLEKAFEFWSRLLGGIPFEGFFQRERVRLEATSIQPWDNAWFRVWGGAGLPPASTPSSIKTLNLYTVISMLLSIIPAEPLYNPYIRSKS